MLDEMGAFPTTKIYKTMEKKNEGQAKLKRMEQELLTTGKKKMSSRKGRRKQVAWRISKGKRAKKSQ